MGKHKTKETLEFIENCKKRAELLGFRVQEELEILDGVFWIDLVFSPYDDGHDTFITLEIESKNNERIQKNLAKIFDSKVTDVEKPFYHFIVVYSGKLSKSNRYLIDQRDKNNIKVFENLKQSPQNIETVFDEIEKLQPNIISYIKRKGEANLGEAVKEAILGIGQVSPVIIIDNKPVYITQATLTSGSLDTTNPAVMSISQVFDSKKYKRIALIPLPEEVYTLVIPGTSFAIDTYMERKTASKTVLIELNPCNYPIIINMTLNSGGIGGSLETKIDPVASDVVQLKKYEDLLRGLYTKGKFVIYDIRSKVIFGAEGLASKEYKQHDEWYSNICDLAFIQETTHIRICAPKELHLTVEDQHHIKMLKGILLTGEFKGPFAEASITAKKGTILELIEDFKKEGTLKHFKIMFGDHEEPILGAKIPLGETSFEFEDVQFKEPLDKIVKELEDKSSEAEIKIKLVPNASNILKGNYLKWEKK